MLSDVKTANALCRASRMVINRKRRGRRGTCVLSIGKYHKRMPMMNSFTLNNSLVTSWGIELKERCTPFIELISQTKCLGESPFL